MMRLRLGWERLLSVLGILSVLLRYAEWPGDPLSSSYYLHFYRESAKWVPSGS